MSSGMFDRGGVLHGFRRCIPFSLLLLAALCSGCGEEGTPAPNVPPETTITGSHPPEGGRVPHHVEIFWSGTDLDGTVRSYDYILETHPRSVATLDQIVMQTPAIDDPRWTHKELPATIQLVVSADTLRADPRGDIGDGTYDRWHTFYVRSVDNAGDPDPTPDSVTFNAYTPAPIVWLDPPSKVASTVTLPRTFVLNFDGADPVGNGNFQDPAEIRWVLLEATLDGGGDPVGFPAALYDLDENEWSDWFAYDAADSTGREAVFREVSIEGEVDKAVVFAVQGRDDGGAITPQFKNAVTRENNMGVIVVQSTLPVGPRITLNTDIETLGPWTFDGAGADPITAMAVGVDSVRVGWDGMQTKHYGANPGQYRFGWNIVNPANDDEWTSWGQLRQAPVFPLGQPGEEFSLQARDHIGQITTATILFQTVP